MQQKFPYGNLLFKFELNIVFMLNKTAFYFCIINLKHHIYYRLIISFLYKATYSIVIHKYNSFIEVVLWKTTIKFCNNVHTTFTL